MMGSDSTPGEADTGDCHPMSSAIVLAAGLSARMGETNKLTLAVAGTTLLQRAVDAVLGAGIEQVLVVLGHQRDEVARSLNSRAVEFVVNKDYLAGQLTSVACGLQAVDDRCDYTLICLGDQPLIDSTHIKTLMNARTSNCDKEIVVPKVNDQRGNPVLISRKVRLRVLADKQHRGCRRYIDQHDDEVCWFEADDRAFITDLDTPDDVQRYLQCQSNAGV